MWVVLAAAGLTVALTVAFWQRIVNWANAKLAQWLGEMFGDDVREAFLLLLTAGDRLIVSVQRAAELVQSRLVRAQIFFRRLSGQEHEKVIRAEVKNDAGEVITVEAAEIVAWHELPDDVREKFIRRQTATVELELKLKE
jgi:hypothetical protein